MNGSISRSFSPVTRMKMFCAHISLSCLIQAASMSYHRMTVKRRRTAPGIRSEEVSYSVSLSMKASLLQSVCRPWIIWRKKLSRVMQKSKNTTQNCTNNVRPLGNARPVLHRRREYRTPPSLLIQTTLKCPELRIIFDLSHTALIE